MAHTWLSIRVELVSGRGLELWPRSSRIFAAARSHTFGHLTDAVDAAFTGWDLTPMHMFPLAESTPITPPVERWDGEAPKGSRDGHSTRLDRLRPGEQFAYVFDFGDDWSRLCTVAAQRVDPLDELSIVPDVPVPYWGWGNLPYQYGRRWDRDDGESPEPKRPARLLADLQPIPPWWGPANADGNRLALPPRTQPTHAHAYLTV